MLELNYQTTSCVTSTIGNFGGQKILPKILPKVRAVTYGKIRIVENDLRSISQCYFNKNQCVTSDCEPLRSVLNSHNGTEKRTRTSTGFPPLAPEASVSTNSTTSAIRAKLPKFSRAVNRLRRNLTETDSLNSIKISLILRPLS